MAVRIEMPKLSDTMEEGVIAKWNVKEGDRVDVGDVIAEVETDKATMEVEVFDAGTVLKILVGEGEAVPLGGLMAVIGEEGEDIEEILASAGEAGAGEKEDAGKEPEKASAPAEVVAGASAASEPSEAASAAPSGDEGRIKVSPLARRMAEEQGIDLRQVTGSGPDGRIIKSDIENYRKPAAATVAYDSLEDEVLPVSQMRKVIARRLGESKYTSPHFYETVDVDMKQAIESRARLNEMSDVKISFNDIVVKAVAHALRSHPDINSSWNEDTITRHGDVNIAVAVAIEDGLVTPVIRHADRKNLRTISSETRELAALSRDRKLQPDQMEGSTFTISNLGMYGIEEFTAIINPPNACILAVGAIRDVPVVENGEVVPGKRMKITLSSDHRIVDGAKAAEFLRTLKGMLENPLAILL